MGYAGRERARAPVLDYSEPSRAERSRPDGESWLLFEGTDTFLYGLTRKPENPPERARAPVLDYSEPSRVERSRPDGGKLAVVV